MIADMLIIGGVALMMFSCVEAGAYLARSRRRRIQRAARAALSARQEVAWDTWCAGAGAAIRAGHEVPKWTEPS